MMPRDIGLSLCAYPNPTINYLTLKAVNIDLTDLHYQLYNLNGQLLNEQAVTSVESTVSLLNYSFCHILPESTGQSGSGKNIQNH